MKILVLSFYFTPDLSAGSFRTAALVDMLTTTLPADSRIDVLTTRPNRYHTFSVEAPEREEHPGLTIHRIAIPPHQSGMLDQSKVFHAFARGALARVAGGRYDVVYATSSRLMTAVLGAWIARRTRARLYLDIRDIFADTIKDVLPGPAAFVARHVFSGLERLAIRSADRVNLVSPGFLPYFTRRYPSRPFSCLTNGIDEDFLRAGPRVRGPAPRPAGLDTITVVYAGNIGEGQGLHLVIPPLARLVAPRVRFRIIGDGGRMLALRNTIRSANLSNVELLTPVDRAALLAEYLSADVLFLHLNDHEAFQKVLPSKIFEYAALGKPVWAGVAGFAAEFISSEVTNSAVFPPCDAEEGARVLNSLVIEDAPRVGFLNKYARSAVTRNLAHEVIALGLKPPVGAA